MTIHVPLWLFFTVIVPVGIVAIVLCWLGIQFVLFWSDMWERWH